MRSQFTCILVILAATAAAAAGQRGGRAACDRTCLSSLADTYFAALVAHDPKRAPIAANVRFTENTQLMAVGDGLWKTATEVPTTFKVLAIDPVAGQLGGIVMMKEGDKPIQLGLRLKVVNRQITEAEHMLVRTFNGNALDNLKSARPGLLATVPPAERLPRIQMLLYAHGYYDSLEQSNGHIVPFADDCLRRENGMTTAGPPTARATPLPGATGNAASPLQGCAEQLDTRVMSYINSIDLRRVFIADEETGLVFGISQFRHPMTEKVLTIINKDGTKGTRDMSRFNPFDLPAMHVFKIRGGQIHEIEAIGFTMPFMSKSGWSEFLH